MTTCEIAYKFVLFIFGAIFFEGVELEQELRSWPLAEAAATTNTEKERGVERTRKGTSQFSVHISMQSSGIVVGYISACIWEEVDEFLQSQGL